MTESDWFTCTDPTAMLSFLRDRGSSERKLRLFAVACCLRVTHINSGDWSELVARTCEALTDRAVAPTELVAAVEAVDAVVEMAGGIFTPAEEAILRLPLHAVGSGPQMTEADAQEVCVSAATAVGYEMVRNSGLEEDRQRAAAPERAAQAALLREVFGNPFRPIVFAPEWRTNTAVALAAQMYESRSFDAMPILADALQDAGCPDGEILEHCRGPGPHVRGCFVVDLVLNKT